MLQQYGAIILSAVLAGLNAYLLAKYNRACKREDNRMDEIKTMQADIAMLKSGYITEDKLRTLLQQEIKNAFKEFELSMINEGRLAPKRRTNA